MCLAGSIRSGAQSAGHHAARAVHGARVGPGPLAAQYVTLATQIRSLLERKPLDPNFRPEAVQWLTLPEQNVQVEMKEGRVYHQGLTILVKDTTLITSGSRTDHR